MTPAPPSAEPTAIEIIKQGYLEKKGGLTWSKRFAPASPSFRPGRAGTEGAQRSRRRRGRGSSAAGVAATPRRRPGSSAAGRVKKLSGISSSSSAPSSRSARPRSSTSGRGARVAPGRGGRPQRPISTRALALTFRAFRDERDRRRPCRGDGSRHRRGCRADIPEGNRTRARGRRSTVESPRGGCGDTAGARRGHSEETSRGTTAAAAWIVRGPVDPSPRTIRAGAATSVARGDAALGDTRVAAPPRLSRG